MSDLSGLVNIFIGMCLASMLVFVAGVMTGNIFPRKIKADGIVEKKNILPEKFIFSGGLSLLPMISPVAYELIITFGKKRGNYFTTKSLYYSLQEKTPVEIEYLRSRILGRDIKIVSVRGL